MRLESNEANVSELTTEQLPCAFQPIFDLRSGRAFAEEALVRCTIEEFKSPLALFERAVVEGACGRLGRLIRESAFAARPDVALFVNLHARELSEGWLVRPDDPICFHEQPVYLEITESATLDYFDLCMNVLKEVCSRVGAYLVIDDFGAGYSNLSRVLELEPTIVKLDRALVSGLHAHPRKRILVEHLVKLCEALGAKVVAEGIETEEELTAVREMGVHFGQGYFLARPQLRTQP